MCRSSTAVVSYTEGTLVKTKQTSNEQVDAAIRHWVLHGGSQAAACRATECDPMRLSRTIADLKSAELLDDHIADIKASAAALEEAGPKPLVDMPTPRSLGAKIQSGANRIGDGRPYGSKGNSWGEYREGHKIGTSAIANPGPVTRAKAEAAAARLQEAGVQIGARTLELAAKKAPGASPPRMGEHSCKLPKGFVATGRKVVLEMRELGMPNLKCMLKAELNAMIRGTDLEAKFENGEITDRVYYTFLSNADLFSENTKPLEDDRALWRHSQNARRQYMVWAEVFVDAKLALFNPKFAAMPEKYFEEAAPREELIFWLPGAELHVASSDETDVAADETARGKSAEQRSVQAAEPGSRRGHGSTKVRAGSHSKVGWRKSKKERRQEAPIDSGEAPAAKGGNKFTFVGTDLMSGDACQTLIVSKQSRETLAKKINLDAVAPESTLVDPITGNKRKARFIQTESGGIDLSTITTILDDILVPAFPASRRDDSEARLSRAPTVDDPDDVICWDGLKAHHSLQWVRAAKSKRVRTLLRYSHGSQDNQHEDFANYSHFKPAFAAEKMKLRVDKSTAAKKEADAQGRTISAQERIAVSKLDDGDVLRAAKGPWEAAFEKQRTLNGWQQEGIFPKYNCALYWRLKAEEEKKQSIDATRPVVEPDESWLRKFDAPHSNAAKISCDPTMLTDESINAEVEKRLQVRLIGGPAPERLPAVAASNVYKLKGSADGEQMAHVLREKEIESRVEARLKEGRKEERDEKKDATLDNSFTIAVEALDLIATSGIPTLKNPQLVALLRSQDKMPKGKVPNKEGLQGLVQDLITQKTPAGGTTAATVSELKRLTEAAAATRAAIRPLALGGEMADRTGPLALMPPAEL